MADLRQQDQPEDVEMMSQESSPQLQTSNNPLSPNSIRRLEAQNAGLRWHIPEVAVYGTEPANSVRLQLEVKKLKYQLNETKERNTKKEYDLSRALQMVNDLEASVNSKDASLATASGKNRRLQRKNQSLETENRDLTMQVAKLETSLEDAQNQLQDEMPRRVDGEYRIQTLKKELEELREVKRQHESCKVELENARQLADRDEKVKDLEQALSTERDVKKQLEQKVVEYQKLINVQLALDSPHRKELDSEEERVRPTTSASGKRKRPNETDSEGVSVPLNAEACTFIAQPASVSGQVTVDEVDEDGKYVRLRNDGDEDQNLGNWQVKRQVGSSAPIAFKFPAEFILKAGQRVTIWAADAGGNHNPPSDLVWETQANWGTGDQFQTTLINTNGEEMEISKATATNLEDDDGNSASTLG
ncbi:lamin-A-like isoform 1-T1 [Syngnathus typhle]